MNKIDKKTIIKALKIILYLMLIIFSFERSLSNARHQYDYVTSPEQVVTIWIILLITGIVGLFLELYFSKNNN